MASPAVDFARSNQARFLDELKALLRIPSVSTLDEHKGDVLKAANLGGRSAPHRDGECRSHPDQGTSPALRRLAACGGQADGFDVRTLRRAAARSFGGMAHSPFEPTERNNNIYARGAVDDKGQL